MVKIPYATLTDEGRAAASEVMAKRSGTIPNLYRMLLHSPPVARGWVELGTAIRYETGLPPRLRELAICRVAALTGSEYEWHHHAPLALDAGATENELKALRDDHYEEAFDDTTAAALRHVSAVVRQDDAGPLPEGLVPLHGTQAVIELTALAAYYTAVSLFLAALDIDIESNEPLADEDKR